MSDQFESLKLALTRKRIEGDVDSAIKEHLLFCNRLPNFGDLTIFTANNNNFKVTLMGILLINKDYPSFE